jgi:hypothetical protein
MASNILSDQNNDVFQEINILQGYKMLDDRLLQFEVQCYKLTRLYAQKDFIFLIAVKASAVLSCVAFIALKSSRLVLRAI